MATSTEQLREAARASFAAGDFRAAREAAEAALAEHPDDAALLHLAGQASLELDRDDAAPLLERSLAADQDNAAAWRDLGSALVSEGRSQEAAEAFRRAIALQPDDPASLVSLGHIELASGRRDDAVGHFQKALEHDPADVGALQALAEAHRGESRFFDALSAVQAVSDSRPDDVLAALDVAELAFQLGRLDEAEAAIRRARAADDDPEHEVHLLHALIEVEARREHWRRALDLAVDASRVDRLGRTTDLLAFIVAQVFGESDRLAPKPEEFELALAGSRAEHRKLHLEDVGI